jgi:hypothetical protein
VDVIPCGFVVGISVSQELATRICYLKDGVSSSSKTWVPVYQSLRFHVQKVRNISL